MPVWLQRRNVRYTLFHLPYFSGIWFHIEPVQSTHQIPFNMLLIGAALVLFRVQRKLPATENIKVAEVLLRTTLNRFLDKKTDSALESALGRISRAYRRGMAIFLNIPEPSIGEYDELWAFYKRSVDEIPELVDAFFAGKFPAKFLKGIPHLLPLEGFASESEEGEKDEKKRKNKSTPSPQRDFQKLLKSDNTEEFCSTFQGRPPKDQNVVIESAVLAFQKVSSFFETLAKSQLRDHRDAINAEIVRLQAIAQRLGD